MKKFIRRIITFIFLPFKKIGKGLNYIFIDNYYKIFLINLPNFFFKIVGISIVIHAFKNIKEDTTNLTNYGFAILIGIASVCFSWTRVLDTVKEPLMIQRISKAGESSLHSAIIFLLASAIKYSTLHLDILIPKSWRTFTIIFTLCLYVVYIISFTLGFYKVDVVLCDINKLLYERLHLNKRD